VRHYDTYQGPFDPECRELLDTITELSVRAAELAPGSRKKPRIEERIRTLNAQLVVLYAAKGLVDPQAALKNALACLRHACSGTLA
jgi:hypothetical protein